MTMLKKPTFTVDIALCCFAAGAPFADGAFVFPFCVKRLLYLGQGFVRRVGIRSRRQISLDIFSMHVGYDYRATWRLTIYLGLRRSAGLRLCCLPAVVHLIILFAIRSGLILIAAKLMKLNIVDKFAP